MIPHKLSLENQTPHSTISSSILTRSVNLSFLHCIITSDKKCFLHVNRKQKFGWHKMRNQCQLQTQAWWNMKGVLYYKLLEHRRTIIADIYNHQFDWVNESLHQKCPGLVNRKDIILQPDNSRGCSAKQTQEKI